MVGTDLMCLRPRPLQSRDAVAKIDLAHDDLAGGERSLDACVLIERFPFNLAHGRRSILLFKRANYLRLVMQPVRSLL